MRSLFHTGFNTRALLCVEVVTSLLQDVSIISQLMTCGQVEFVVKDTETLLYIQRISPSAEQQPPAVQLTFVQLFAAGVLHKRINSTSGTLFLTIYQMKSSQSKTTVVPFLLS